jgi:kinesin family protein 2/24
LDRRSTSSAATVCECVVYCLNCPGRIHGAVVSGVNDAAMTVTVEWFENEETKGKELDIKNVLSMNPDLAPKPSVKSEKPAHAPTYVEKAPLKTKQETPASAVKAARPGTSVSTPAKAQPDGGAAKPAQAARPPAPVASAATAPKKAPSKTVQEIQKLEKQREERRAKAQDKAEKKEQRGGKDNVNQDFMQMIDEFRESIDISPLDPQGPVSSQKITVCVRKRPLNKKELANFDYDVVTVPTGSEILVHEPKTKVDLSKYLDNHNFRFDHVFDDDITNATIYRFTAAPLVRTIFEGGFATCFAYGQTGLFVFIKSRFSLYRQWKDIHNGRRLYRGRAVVQSRHLPLCHF